VTDSERLARSNGLGAAGHVTWYGSGPSCPGRHRQQARADAGNSSVPSACEDPRWCSARPRRRGSNLRVLGHVPSGWRRAAMPQDAVGSRPTRMQGTHPCLPRARIHVCAQRALAVEGQICEPLGHGTSRWRRAVVPGTSSAAGPRRCGELIRASRMRWTTFVRSAPSSSRVEFASPLVTLLWIAACCRAAGRRRQPALAVAGNSSVPSAGEEPRLCSARPRRRGSNLRAPWSRYSGWQLRAVLPETSSAAGPRGCGELIRAFRMRGFTFVRSTPSSLGVEFTSPLVTLLWMAAGY